ncbi:MAG: substrate-binding domain-containing protein [Candidatus Omnitrophota bacterium]
MAKIPKVILLIETSRAYGRQLLRGITKYSRLHGPWVFYSEPGGLEKALPKLKNWDADGAVMRDSRMGEELLKMGVPIIISVHLKEHIKGTPYIDTNGVRIGRMAAEHLLDHGFHHFAYCGYDELHWSQRQGNFGKRVAEAGFEAHIYKRPKSRSRQLWENEQALVVDWLKSLPKPVGLMACNDDRGRELTEACKMAGLRVPEEVAIIGVDNDELVCELSDPPLSSVALNVERGGYEAAELLDKLMAGKESIKKDIIIEPMYVVSRQSTDILAVEDRQVAEALHFIRQHSKKMIQVSDVLDRVLLSRRSLENRFRRLLGRSIHEEIRRVRIERVVQMLVESNLPVGQIALALNFTSNEHISRYFRKEKGMSPQAYRKKYGHK